MKREFRRLLEAVQAHMEPINAIHAFFNDVVKPTFGSQLPEPKSFFLATSWLHS